jgi:hypothetical protein
MSPLRRAPREVYRVYREEEFLAGVEGEEETLGDAGADELAATATPAEAAPRPRAVTRSHARAASLRRAAGVVVTAAAIGVLAGLIALRDQSGPSAIGRRVAGGRGLQAGGQALGWQGRPALRRARPRAQRATGRALGKRSSRGTKRERRVRATAPDVAVSSAVAAPESQPGQYREFGFER